MGLSGRGLLSSTVIVVMGFFFPRIFVSISATRDEAMITSLRLPTMAIAFNTLFIVLRLIIMFCYSVDYSIYLLIYKAFSYLSAGHKKNDNPSQFSPDCHVKNTIQRISFALKSDLNFDHTGCLQYLSIAAGQILIALRHSHPLNKVSFSIYGG